MDQSRIILILLCVIKIQFYSIFTDGSGWQGQMNDIKILIVDDEENILTIFRLALEGRGYKVDTASTAEEALVKVGLYKYNICLLDLNLPDMHGTELVRQIHQLDPKMKKLMVTGESSGIDTQTALDNGADGLILKPVNRATLLSAVEAALRSG
jgi:DNA-binding response OmpR family regulator